MDPNNLQQMIHITLRGKNNITYTGTIVLSNIIKPNMSLPGANSSAETEGKDYDQQGASYYVVAVVLVYGMSIVMLIASHIKRRHDKIVEDKQIDRYLQDFQIVKERQARESYKRLKRSIADKLKWDRSKTYRNLHHTILPLVAVGIAGSTNNMDHTASLESIHSNTSKRKVFPSSRRSSRDSCHGESSNTNLLHPDHAYHAPVHLTLSDDSDIRRVRFTPPPEGVQPDPDSLSAHSAVGSLRGSRILTDIIEHEEPVQSDTEKDSYKGSLQDITISIPQLSQLRRPTLSQTDDVTQIRSPSSADDTIWMQQDDSVSSSSERLLARGDTSPSLSPMSARSSPVPLSELGSHSPTSTHSETEKLLHITCV